MNVKLIALGPAIVVLFQSCFVLFYPIVTLSFFTDICQHFLTAKLTKNVYYLFIYLFYFMGSVCLFCFFVLSFWRSTFGTRQYTRAVWSIFADIQSARFIDALFGVTGISGYLIAISENTWSFDYFWYSVG